LAGYRCRVVETAKSCRDGLWVLAVSYAIEGKFEVRPRALREQSKVVFVRGSSSCSKLGNEFTWTANAIGAAFGQGRK
jgi:hypothetical protein